MSVINVHEALEGWTKMSRHYIVQETVQQENLPLIFYIIHSFLEPLLIGQPFYCCAISNFLPLLKIR